MHDELQCPVCTGKIAAKKDCSKRGGANVLSAKAAQRCLEVLQASLLSDDADAKKRLLTPIPSTGDELHGPVDKKRWTASKPHADLGSVFAKLKPDAPGLYGTIPDVLKDLRRIKRTTDKLWPDINEHPTRLAAQKLVQEVDALWEGLCDEMYAANAESKTSTTEACSILEPQEPGGGYKPQQYPLPKEEDLNNWSHHASLETCGDEVLKKALRGRDDVTFVFGMYQDWNLIQQDTAAQAKIEEEQRLEREAKERLDAEAALDEDEEVPVVEKKKKKKKKHKSESSQSSGTDGDAAMAPVEKKKKKKKKKKKSVEEDADMDAAAALETADADAAPEAVVETTPPDAVITQPPPAPAPRIDSQESSQPTPDWPRPGQIIECVWTKGSSLSDGDVDRCVVESIRDPVPHKKRKAGVPEHLAYQCYAQLKSLIKLAGDTDQPYETVPESDPRPKHVHLKYKLDLADHGRTWRILPVSKKASQRESVGETFSAMSDLTNN